MSDNININYFTARDILSKELSLEIFPASFKRMLQKNPYVKVDDPVVFFSTLDGRVVSKLFLMPHDLRYNGRNIRWFWGQNFYTDVSLRGKGIGTNLYKKLLSELNSRNICYGAYAMSDITKRINDKCGLTNLGRFPRYILLLNLRPILDHFFRIKLIKKIGTVICNNILFLIISLLTYKLGIYKNKYYIEQIANFDERVDQFISKYEPQLWLQRCSVSLNWKLEHAVKNAHPPKEYKAFYIKEVENDSIIGYFILRFGNYDNLGGRPYKNVGVSTVVDFFIDPKSKEAFYGFIYYVINEAKHLNSDVLEIITNDKNLKVLLKNALFLHKGGYDFWYNSPTSSPLREDYCISAKNWWITAGESDAFFF